MNAHVIVLPGGGYEVRAAHEGQPVVTWLNRLGMSAAVHDYPLRTRHPAPLDSVRRAVRAARADGHRNVGVIGFSAGGHLAGHAALTQPSNPLDRIDFAILGYPIVSMESNVYPSAGHTLIGADATPTLRAQTSLDRLVTHTAPPLFIWHTAEDKYVPVSETYRLASALAEARVPHTAHVFARGPHSLALATGAGEAAQWTALAEAWLQAIARRQAMMDHTSAADGQPKDVVC